MRALIAIGDARVHIGRMQTADNVAVVIGASGAIGGAMADLLEQDPAISTVLRFGRSLPGTAIDLADEATIANAAAHAAGAGSLRTVIVATGELHQPEKSMRALDGETLTRAFAVNAIGPALVAKHFLPHLPRNGRSVFAALSARVGSIADNRLGGWHGYRASKAALNQLVRTLAIELARSRPDAICVTLHPGTVDSALSSPFQANVAPEKLFRPAQAAAALLSVLAGLTPSDTGGFFAWDGQAIPY